VTDDTRDMLDCVVRAADDMVRVVADVSLTTSGRAPRYNSTHQSCGGEVSEQGRSRAVRDRGSANRNWPDSHHQYMRGCVQARQVQTALHYDRAAGCRSQRPRRRPARALAAEAPSAS